MSCKKCKSFKDRGCGCIQQISAKCVVFQGQENSFFDVYAGDNIEYILNILLTALEELYNQPYVSNAVNIGGGIGLFKKKNSDKILEFKSITNSDSIKITTNSEELNFKVDEDWLIDVINEEQEYVIIESEGNGTPILRKSLNNTNYIKTIKSKDSNLIITEQDGGIVIENPTKSLDLASIGNGNPIYVGEIGDQHRISSIDSFGNGEKIYSGYSNGTHKIATLATDNLNITKIGDTIVINAPQEDPGMKYFYVNSNYGGVEEGSMTKPFKTVDNALVAYVGSGTSARPQYTGVGKIILLSNATLTNPIKINRVVIDLQGNTLTYTGSNEYMYNTETIAGIVGYSDGYLNESITFEVTNGTIILTNYSGAIKSTHYKKSGTLNDNQKTVNTKLTDITIEDRSFENKMTSFTYLKDSAGSDVYLFSQRVKLSNTNFPKIPLLHIKDVNWNEEGGVSMNGVCKFTNWSGDVIRFENTTFNSTSSISVSKNTYHIPYTTLIDGYFPEPQNDNNNIHVIDAWVRFANLEDNSSSANVQVTIPTASNNTLYASSSKAYFKVTTSNNANKRSKGALYVHSGKVWGATASVIMDSTNDTIVEFKDFDGGSLRYIDSFFTTRTITGNSPFPIYIDVDDSVFKKVTNNANIIIRAANAAINDSLFMSGNNHADNATAIAAGLIPGNIYFNTTTNTMTKVI